MRNPACGGIAKTDPLRSRLLSRWSRRKSPETSRGQNPVAVRRLPPPRRLFRSDDRAASFPPLKQSVRGSAIEPSHRTAAHGPDPERRSSASRSRPSARTIRAASLLGSFLLTPSRAKVNKNDPERRRERETSMSPFVDTPDTLLQAITVESPQHRLRVRGTVVDLTPFPRKDPRWIYGRLRGTEATIGFRCAVDDAPAQEGSAVILEGRVQVKPSKFKAGLDVMLYGETVGSWQGRPRQPIPSIHLRRERPRVPLHTLLEKHHPTEILLIATARGFQDFTSTNLPVGPHQWRWLEANFGDRTRLLHALRAASESVPAGVAILRGGSADSSMELWNDPEVVEALLDWDLPFYTAIGHSDQLLLADKFADAAFTTPSALGHEVRTCLLDRLSYDHLVSRLVQQTRLWKILCLLLTSFLVVLLLIRWFFPI